MSAALDGYDGLLRIYQPDDLYLIGSRAALISLRNAINQALAQGVGSYVGLIVEGQARSVVVNRIEPRESNRAVQLYDSLSTLEAAGWPFGKPESKPPSQGRPQPTRAPQLAGVDREYW